MSGREVAAYGLEFDPPSRARSCHGEAPRHEEASDERLGFALENRAALTGIAIAR